MKPNRIAAAWLAAAFTLAAAPAALAQAWPNKPVRVINPFAAGGGTDTFARPLAARLSQTLGQTVLIENQGGAGGTLGAANAAKAAPDGYTLFMGAVHHTIAETLYTKLPYSLEKDFMPITMVASVPNVLVVGTQVPSKTLKELVDLAKSKPGELNYGSAGVGAASHLNGEMFNSAAGVKMVHVPFKGFSEQLVEIYAGRVQMTWAPVILALSHIQSGRLRPLAVSTAKRSTSLPNVPTVAETAIPGFVYDPWFAVFAPAATSKSIVKELNRAIVKTLDLPDVRQQLQRLGAEPVSTTPEETDKYIRAEIDKLGKVVKASGATAE